MGFVGVFPKDVWRVILHFVLEQHHREAFFKMPERVKYYGRPEEGSRLYTGPIKFAMCLITLSRIHPTIRTMLKTATYRPLQGLHFYSIRRLYGA